MAGSHFESIAQDLVWLVLGQSSLLVLKNQACNVFLKFAAFGILPVQLKSQDRKNVRQIWALCKKRVQE